MQESLFFSRDLAGGALLKAIGKNAECFQKTMQTIQHPYGKSQIEKLHVTEVFFQLIEKHIVQGMGVRCNNFCELKHCLLSFGQVGSLEIFHLLDFFFAQSFLLRRSRPDCSSMAASGKPGRFDAGHFYKFRIHARLGVNVSHETEKDVQHPLTQGEGAQEIHIIESAVPPDPGDALQGFRLCLVNLA
jgi:hypothetical protein